MVLASHQALIHKGIFMASTKKIFLQSSVLTTLLCLATPFIPCSQALASTNDIDRLIEKAEQRRIQIAQRMESSTVFIFTETSDGISMGTGFVVAPNYILTNGHVVNDGESFYVVGKDFAPVEAELVKWVYNNVKDYALLKVDMPSSLPVLSFNLELRRTDKVSAWGFPYMVTQYDKNIDNLFEGERGSMPPVVYTEGHVSTFVQNSHGRKSIVHTAAIASGNSGGPLVNSRGEVVGINTWGATDDDEGAFINASLTAHEAVAFLRSCGIEPSIVQKTQHASLPFVSQDSSENTQTPLPVPSSQPQNNATSPFAAAGTIVQDAVNAVGGGASSSVFPFSSATQAPQLSDIEPSPRGLTGDAKEFYDEAVNGNAEAQAYLGIAHWEGGEAPENMAMALMWLQRSAAQNNADALCMLGIIYISDEDYHNPQQGLELLKKASKQDADYASILAHFQFFGEQYGIARDAAASLKAAQRGVEKAQDPEAKALLSFLYFYGENVVDADEERALTYAREAAKDDVALAYGMLSLLYNDSSVLKNDSQKAFEYAQKGADGNDGLSKALLAAYYYDGDGTEQDFAKALQYAQESSEEFQEIGQLILANMYAEGKGVTKNLPYAWAYYDLAEKKNMLSAIENKKVIEQNMTKKEIQAAQQYAKQLVMQKGLSY